MKLFDSFRKEYLDEAYLEEKNKPTSPEKWARAKSAAKSKFAVYPSAYANAWAAKKYKSMGGGWRSANEEVEQIEEGETIVTPKKTVYGEPLKGTYAYERKYGKFTAKGELRKRPNPNKPPVKESLDESHVAIAMGKELDDEGSMALNQLDQIQRSCEMLRNEIKDPEMQLPGWVQSKITLAADYMETVAGYMASKNEKVSEEVEEIHEGDYSVTVTHIKDDQKADHEYVIKNAQSAKHAKHIAMNRHANKVGRLQPGEQFSASSQSVRELNKEEVELDETTPAWQRKEGKSAAGGLNRKGIASYRRENPGSKLSMAVTTKPSKLKPGSKAANRRKSFCARMGGMKKRLTSAKTARDPDSRINKALRKWNC